MGKPARVYHDPRTNRLAARLMQDAMQDVAGRMIDGQDHYRARDSVLRELAPAWSQLAGKEAADRAVRGLHCLAPTEYLTKPERRTHRDAERVRALEVLATHRPEANSRLNRFWIRLTGMALYALVAFAGAPLAGADPAQALDSHQERWRALAACGRATMGSAEYDRRCRRFSRTERSVTRAYDGSGAGAPRDWEQPKEWE